MQLEINSFFNNVCCVPVNYDVTGTWLSSGINSKNAFLELMVYR